jgi:hypothetical protein
MESISQTIVRLSQEAQASGSDTTRQAARATGGLPVWSDMGGLLVLMPTTEIIQYDLESRTLSPVHRPEWQVLALVKAARLHPELAGLMPARPATAASCDQCAGTGRLFDAVDCGQCMGTGWFMPRR